MFLTPVALKVKVVRIKTEFGGRHNLEKIKTVYFDGAPPPPKKKQKKKHLILSGR